MVGTVSSGIARLVIGTVRDGLFDLSRHALQFGRLATRAPTHPLTNTTPVARDRTSTAYQGQSMTLVNEII
jgi:hypothetical protein